jgi:glycosyltransferase involved in cell wall biosynthesis
MAIGVVKSSVPRISVVMPSYNYGRYIEEAIRSVIFQEYPNTELIVMDGGSTDETVNVLRRYDDKIDFWVSEKDGGQTDAINRGFARCTGDVFVWLNADDYFTPGAFTRVATAFKQGAQLIGGGCENFYPDGHIEHVFCRVKSLREYLRFWTCPHYPQPAAFVARELASRAFPLSTWLYSVMDYQFFLRVLQQRPHISFFSDILVRFRYHGLNKTGGEYNDGLKEFVEVSTSEAAGLSVIARARYAMELKGYLTMNSLMKKLPGLQVGELLKNAIIHPSILESGYFWKVLLRQSLGAKKYEAFKGIRS